MTADKTHHDADINPDYSALVDAAVAILTTAKAMISSVYPMHSRIGAALDALESPPDSWPTAHFGPPPIKIKDAMLVPEVAALVMAARRARQEAVADEMDGWFADLVTALRAMEGGA